MPNFDSLALPENTRSTAMTAYSAPTGPASASRYPYGGRPPRYRPCSRVCAAIAVRTRTRVRVISRFDDNPSATIVCS